ncbi:MAG: methyltransferase domain-containing protein [Parvularculaceae bacterium]
MKAAPPIIFNRKLYRRRRARGAARFAERGFLHERAMDDVVDRLETTLRDFPDALFIGAGGLTSRLTEKCGVGNVIEGDPVRERLCGDGASVLFDEEALPFADNSFDLAVSLLTLHATNDLIGVLTQLRRALKPDGLLIAVLFAEETLGALRAALLAAESEFSNGAAARVAPFANVKDLGQAMMRAGLALPVADIDRIEVAYRSPMRLIEDLRAMGETNALQNRAPSLSRHAAAAALAAMEGKTVRFDVATLTGWAPHESQPKPLAPGSASHSLEKAVRDQS